MELEKFGLFNKLTAVEGKRDDLAKILLEASKSMEQLDDCDLYVVSLGNESTDSIYVYEVWADENAHQASLSLEVFQTLIQKAKPIIAGMEKVNTLSPLGGKGIFPLIIQSDLDCTLPMQRHVELKPLSSAISDDFTVK